MEPRTVNDVIATLPPSPKVDRLLASPYSGLWSGQLVGFAVPSMERHTSDEGWQLFQALQSAGYQLHGHGLGFGTKVWRTLALLHPKVAVLQDKREWEGRTAGPGFDDRERFDGVTALDGCDGFVLTVLKDAQRDPEYHRRSAEEIGCHAWIVYYHPRIVTHLAPFVRPEHCVRTYHSIDKALVPEFRATRSDDPLISGALSGCYPLRQRLVRELPHAVHFSHPGYRRDGCHTPGYLKMLTRFKVSVCTSSVYGYALRKIIESTACGCRVVTDLPADDVLPRIDDNLVRVHPDESTRMIDEICRSLAADYDPERQQARARAAMLYYDYPAVGKRLAGDIETLRSQYGN